MTSFFQSLPISATQCHCLLLLTCLLALAASFPDVDIRNLYLLNGTMDDIMNAPPQSSQLGRYGPPTGRGQQGPEQSGAAQPTSSPACPHLCHTKAGLSTDLRVPHWNKSNLRVPLCLLPASSPAWHEVLLSIRDRIAQISELTGSQEKGQFGLSGSKTKPRVLWAMCSILEKG